MSLSRASSTGPMGPPGPPGTSSRAPSYGPARAKASAHTYNPSAAPTTPTDPPSYERSSLALHQRAAGSAVGMDQAPNYPDRMIQAYPSPLGHPGSLPRQSGPPTLATLGLPSSSSADHPSAGVPISHRGDVFMSPIPGSDSSTRYYPSNPPTPLRFTSPDKDTL